MYDNKNLYLISFNSKEGIDSTHSNINKKFNNIDDLLDELESEYKEFYNDDTFKILSISKLDDLLVQQPYDFNMMDAVINNKNS